MTDEKKKELFPYFAYLYSQELNPDKYGNVSSAEEWTSLIQESPEDINEISAAALELTDEDWDNIEQQYAQAQSEGSTPTEEIQAAKKGAKLKKLQELKSGGKGKKKRCACGCEMVSKKEKGGHLVDVCSCCGKTHKFQEGGIMKFQNPSSGIMEVRPGWYQGYHTGTNFKTALSRNKTIVERALSDYLNNPNVMRALAQAEREVRPSTGNFDTTQSPHYFGSASAAATYTNRPAPIVDSKIYNGGELSPLTVVANKPRPTGVASTQSPNQRGNRNTSVVDYLNSVGENSSFNARKQLASALGIQNYTGNVTQNIQLLNLLKQGKGPLGALKQNLVHNPVIAPISGEELASLQSKKVPTTVAANRKGGLIKKAQKGGETNNPALKGMKPAQIDSVQAYNKSAPVTAHDKKAKFDPTSDPRNAKGILKDLRSGKSKLDPEEAKRLKEKLAKTRK